ncbi:PREDICTED: syntaxin-132-like [Nelumbo nucifera]|uniref:Syntaxin-132-like n=1 Tax=Nelumbo nucifera TaxID=4432 RepID=A0A1U7Z9G1_NELNU|nr:PREDICTED: syntaxin-132-like [Nelumbo nucifera]
MHDLLSGSFDIPRRQPSSSRDVELGAPPPTSSGDFGLENFFKQVEDIEKQIDKLNKLLKKLQDANEDSKSVTKAVAMKAIKRQMQKDVDEVGTIARFVKSKIEALDREVMRFIPFLVFIFCG